MSDRVEILLAVYNGAHFLREQIDSLLRQECDTWTLLVRDDGSRDESADILSDYQKAYPDRIRVVSSDMAAAGTMSNFSSLLRLSTAHYVMLCDQDDLWLPDKISVTLRKMQECERRHGRDCPILIHTDMRVTDANLQTLSESLWRYQKSDPEKGAALNRLLVQNVATGCSMMINAPLRDLALPIPREAMMHDWWLALVAAAFGRIGYVAEPTLLYRQHGRNDTGAKQWSVRALARQLMRDGGMRPYLAERNRVIRETNRQAQAFRERFEERLTPEQRRLITAYLTLDSRPFVSRKWLFLKYRFFHTGFLRNVVRFLLW